METAISERIHNMQSKVENMPEAMQDVDIDSAAAVGGGLKLLGNIELTNL